MRGDIRRNVNICNYVKIYEKCNWLEICNCVETRIKKTDVERKMCKRKMYSYEKIDATVYRDV